MIMPYVYSSSADSNKSMESEFFLNENKIYETNIKENIKKNKKNYLYEFSQQFFGSINVDVLTDYSSEKNATYAYLKIFNEFFLSYPISDSQHKIKFLKDNFLLNLDFKNKILDLYITNSTTNSSELNVSNVFSQIGINKITPNNSYEISNSNYIIKFIRMKKDLNNDPQYVDLISIFDLNSSKFIMFFTNNCGMLIDNSTNLGSMQKILFNSNNFTMQYYTNLNKNGSFDVAFSNVKNYIKYNEENSLITINNNLTFNYNPKTGLVNKITIDKNIYEINDLSSINEKIISNDTLNSMNLNLSESPI